MGLSLTILGFIFVIGLVVGSFLNVVILRTVSEESIVFPGSKCPSCQTPLKWYHNIPLLSYIFLRGKCAFCQNKISWQYPLVEFITGCIFVGLFLKYCSPFDILFGLDVINPISLGELMNYIFALIVSCLFIVLSGTDFIEQKVADIHTYSLIGIGILYSIIASAINFIYYTKENGMPVFDLNFFITCPIVYVLANAILGFIIIEAIALISLKLVGARAFGEGDSYIAAGIGAIFGALMGSSYLYNNFLPIFQALIASLLLALAIQVVVTIPIFLKKLWDGKNWLTFSAIVGFIIYTIGFLFAQNAGWFANAIAYWTSTIVLFGLGIWTCKEILSGIKENKAAGGLYLPFGPALVIAAFLIMIATNI